ncbi:MAG TPA: CHAT domain-containing protein [Kofleriaceae bacterium]|nr:CHAT domain-containing protein [Kofleriaceae bacterium]
MRGAIVALAAIAPVVVMLAVRPGSACEDAFGREQWLPSVQICRAEHPLSGDDHVLVLEARALLWLGDLAQAKKLAISMLGGPRAADAHGILARIADMEYDFDEAQVHASLARVLHALIADTAGALDDLDIQSIIDWQRGHYVASVTHSNEVLRMATQQHDRRMAINAYFTRSDALRLMGATNAAATSLQELNQPWLTPCKRVEFHLRLSWIYSAKGTDADATGDAQRELHNAEVSLASCPTSPWSLQAQILLGQAALLVEKDPTRALAKLDQVKAHDGDGYESLLLRAYLASYRGDLEAVGRYLSGVADRTQPDDDWLFELERARGNLAELLGSADAAERHYRRGIELVAEMRARSSSESGYVIAAHRGPFDDLIELLAAQGRWRDVLRAILELDANDMLHGNDDEGLGPHVTPEAGRGVPTVDEVLAAWRGRDLVILFAPTRRQVRGGTERSYRIRVRDGEVTGEAIGDPEQLRQRVQELNTDPSSQAAWRYLADKVVPAGASEEPLYVLAIGALSKLTLSALRDPDGGLTAARRPLIRMQRLWERTPVVDKHGRAVVLADSDPERPLLSARIEARAVMHELGAGATMYEGGGVTFAHLREARDAEILHVAVHVVVEARWHAIRLAEHDVFPREIIAEQLAPKLVVLSGCESGVSEDEEGWGSVGAAFLESGAQYVIVTAHFVNDRDALPIMKAFYQQPDRLSNPAHALAVAQQQLVSRLMLDVAARDPETLQTLRSWLTYSVMARPPFIAAHG